MQMEKNATKKRRTAALRRSGIALLVAAMAAACAPLPATAASYVMDADSSGFVLPARSAVSGNKAVWIENNHVHYIDLATMQKRQLTTVASPKDTISIGGELVVWEDKRGIDASAMPTARHIVVYDLATGEEHVATSAPGQHVNPSTDGRVVVWYDRDTRGDMYIYDPALGTTEPLGQGRYPIVSDGVVAFRQSDNSGLSMIDLATGTETSLYETEGGEFIEGFAFQGSTLLWKIRSFEGLTHYMSLKLDASEAAPVQLTEPSKKEREFAIMAVGDGYVSWVEDVGGVAQIMAADLATQETFQVTNSRVDQTFLAMEGDRFVTKAEDGTLTRSTATPDAGAGAGTDAEAASEVSTRSIVGAVGPEGGDVVASNGAFRLRVPEGAVEAQTQITVRWTDVEGDEESGEYERKSPTWSVSSTRPLAKPAALTLTYAGDGMTKLEHEKTNAFLREADGTWTYLGGKTDAAAAAVELEWTRQTGDVAVVQRNATFRDIRAHWGKDAIEVLAAKNVVAGFEDGTYRPDAPVTRAQFVKLLVGALGWEASAPTAAAFADVGKTHWAYDVVHAAAQAGWVKGDGDAFRPDEPVTREQMSVMLVRAIGSNAAAAGAAELSRFADEASISAWAQADVAAAVRLGLLAGSDGKFLPQKTTTRAEAATVLYRALPLLSDE